MTAPAPPQAWVAPRRPASRGRRLVGPLLTGGLVVAGTVALHVRDPHVSGSWGYCPVSLVTGFDCPGCGALRAVNHLGNGEVLAAASSNLLFTLAAPVLVAAWVLWLARSWRPAAPDARPPTTRHLRPALVWAVAGVAVALFTVLRNLPVGAWLHS